MMLKDTCEVCGNKDFELIGKKQINGIRTKNSSFNFKVRLVCCKKCGVVFQSPLQKLDKLEAYYATMFREEGFRPPETIIKQFSRRVDFACKFLEKSQKVMEIGCADGSTLDIFKNKGMIPYGIEPSKDNALICQKKGIKVFNGIYEKYPISEGNYFDIVCSYFVLEHLVSPVDFLSFCNRLLDLGKTLCIEVPDIGAYRKEKTSSDLLFFFEHQFHFTRETIRILLQRCGFELIEFDSWSSRPFAMHFAARKVSSPINVSDLIIPPDIFGKIMKYVQEDRSNLIKRELYIRKRLADLASKGSLVGNIVIFGAGGYTKDILEFPELKGVEIKYIVDNNRDKQGTVFYNLPVYPVEKIDKQIKKIIISSFEFEEEIFKQLLKMGINEDRIIKLYS